MIVGDYTRLNAQVAILREIAIDYPSKTIENIIAQLKSREKILRVYDSGNNRIDLSSENLQFGDRYKIPDGYAVFLKEDSDGYHFIVHSYLLDDCKIMVYDSFGLTYPDTHREFMLICKA